MKIIFFETTNSSPHLETSFDLAKQHLDKGDEVHYHFLGHAVEYTEFLVPMRRALLPGCLPERKAASLIRSIGFQFIDPRKVDVMRDIDLPDFSDIEQLKNYRYKTYNAGLSALSSLVSHTKHSKPDLTENRDLLRRMLLSGISIYEYCLTIIRDQCPDVIYLFNGRFANNRAILDAAIETRTPCLIHERGANKNKYTSRHFMPHDFEKVRNLIKDNWKENKSAESFEVGREFYRERREGVDQGWYSFTARQTRGMLNHRPHGERKLIAYFSSSDDEYVSVGDIVKWDRWPDQLAAVRALIDIVRSTPALDLVIRIHPHMMKKDIRDLNDWLELDLPSNAKLILPDDPTDSYELIDRADIVITSGSTVGIEAVFWGTPSVCLGPSLYSDLDAVYLPEDDQELEEVLLRGQLEANPDRALPYGYYMSTVGDNFVHYKAETLAGGSFMGVNLQKFGICRYLRGMITRVFWALRKIRGLGSRISGAAA